MIQFDNLVTLTEETAPPQLNRYNRFVSATVSAGLAKGKTISQGLAEMDKISKGQEAIKKDTTKRRLRIKQTIRKRVFGSTERPRFSVYRSLNDIYGQIIDDVTGKTIIALSTNSKEVKAEIAAAKTKVEKSDTSR